MRRNLIRGCLLAAAFAVCVSTTAQQNVQEKVQKKAAAKAAQKVEAAKEESKPEADAAAIRANAVALVKALNSRDAKAGAAAFTPTGEFVDGDGNGFHGRAAIEAEFAALFEANPNGRVEITPHELRAIAPGVVTEEGTATVGPADKSSAVTVSYTIVHVRQADGKWLIASLRSNGDEDVTPHEQLKQLQWLIGDWIDESDDAVVRTSTRWSDDKNFILSDFHVQVAGRRAMSGTVRIGWDGSIGKFRSWVFDTEGGHASGLWTQVGDRWVVRITGVRPDGEIGTATNVFIPNGNDSITLTSADRIVGDEAVPDTTVKMVRKPPEPKKQAAK